jgi:hypothetical protein
VQISPKQSEMNIFWITEFLDAEYKQVSTRLDDVIKICEDLHVEEQHHLKILLRMNLMHLFMES